MTTSEGSRSKSASTEKRKMVYEPTSRSSVEMEHNLHCFSQESQSAAALTLTCNVETNVFSEVAIVIHC